MVKVAIAKQPIPTVIITGQGPTSGNLPKLRSMYPHAKVWTCNSNTQPSDLHFDMHYIGAGRKLILNPFAKGHVTRETYPQEAIMREFRVPYFKCAISYMVALAVYMRFERMIFCGVDYVLDHGREPEEKANVELWVGVAMSRHVQFLNMRRSSLFDGKEHYFYGLIGGKYEGDWMPPEAIVKADKEANEILKKENNG